MTGLNPAAQLAEPLAEPRPVVRRAAERRLARIEAVSRLRFALRAIATDLLGPFESDELPRELAIWLDTATDGVVSVVCDDALLALSTALDAALVTAPIDVPRRLDEARRRHESGLI
ncbi:MAG: hypothetical protein ACRDGQ_14920 [Candidatus Limnocylindrales bacterium]